MSLTYPSNVPPHLRGAAALIEPEKQLQPIPETKTTTECLPPHRRVNNTDNAKTEQQTPASVAEKVKISTLVPEAIEFVPSEKIMQTVQKASEELNQEKEAEEKEKREHIEIELIGETAQKPCEDLKPDTEAQEKEKHEHTKVESIEENKETNPSATEPQPSVEGPISLSDMMETVGRTLCNHEDKLDFHDAQLNVMQVLVAKLVEHAKESGRLFSKLKAELDGIDISQSSSDHDATLVEEHHPTSLPTTATETQADKVDTLSEYNDESNSLCAMDTLGDDSTSVQIERLYENLRKLEGKFNVLKLNYDVANQESKRRVFEDQVAIIHERLEELEKAILTNKTKDEDVNTTAKIADLQNRIAGLEVAGAESDARVPTAKPGKGAGGVPGGTFL